MCESLLTCQLKCSNIKAGGTSKVAPHLGLKGQNTEEVQRTKDVEKNCKPISFGQLQPSAKCAQMHGEADVNVSYRAYLSCKISGRVVEMHTP